MYTPLCFKAEDRELIQSVVEQNPFATVVTAAEDGLKASHLPCLYDRDRGENGVLISHMAKANRHWKVFEGSAETLIIFQGPHAYVSPTWYIEQFSVPTWNYAVVHFYGRPTVLEEEETYRLLVRTLQQFEGPESTYDMAAGESYIRKIMPGVVAFEMPVTRVEAKFKMSQNKTPVDRMSVIQHLLDSAAPIEQETAAFMMRVYSK